MLDRLKKELSPALYYHSIDQMLDVLDASMRIASLEGLDAYEIELLTTAVYFHDSGFIYTRQEHEEKGCEIARSILGEFGYNEEEIDRICGMILATKIPQTPHNRLEQIICDADLDYLGRDDFWVIGDKLFRELVHHQILKSAEEWNRIQLKFIGAHHFFTGSAHKMRQEKKEEHLKAVTELVESY